MSVVVRRSENFQMRSHDNPPLNDGTYLALGGTLSAGFAAVVSGEVTWPGGKVAMVRPVGRGSGRA
jgi:hypothetical protein